MPVIYFVPDLTAQPASIPHQQGHCNADNWSGAWGFFAYFWLITSWCTSNWPNISSNRTALLHCCAECQKTLSSAKLHCLSRLMQNTISVRLSFEHKDPFFISFNVNKKPIQQTKWWWGDWERPEWCHGAGRGEVVALYNLQLPSPLPPVSPPAITSNKKLSKIWFGISASQKIQSVKDKHHHRVSRMGSISVAFEIV
jgi:hypothetical protein